MRTERTVALGWLMMLMNTWELPIRTLGYTLETEPLKPLPEAARTHCGRHGGNCGTLPEPEGLEICRGQQVSGAGKLRGC